MFNHARTLLLNQTGSPNPATGTVALELIPPDYEQLTLPDSLNKVRRILFGETPDTDFLQYRTAQFMSLLHSSDLEQHVLALDSRINYDKQQKHLFEASNFGFFSESPLIELTGQLPSADTTGVMRYRWLFRSTDGVVLFVQWRSPKPFSFYTEQKIVDLIPSGLAKAVVNFEITGEWLAHAVVRPEFSMGVIAAKVRNQAAQHINDLFLVGRPEGNDSRMVYFRKLWESHPSVIYQLGGLLLGLIYHSELVRLNNV